MYFSHKAAARREQETAAAVLREGVFPVPRFTFDWSDQDAACPACGLPLRVRLTREPRRVVSLAYGNFVAIERQGYCPDHSGLPPARSLELRRIVPSGSNVAYDVLVRIGMARFLECRQLEEIQADLSTHHHNHIEIPVKTIGYLVEVRRSHRNGPDGVNDGETSRA